MLERGKGMTKRQYEAMATEFGRLLATVGDPDEARGVWRSVAGFARVAKAENPRFDRDGFENLVNQIAVEIKYGKGA